MRRIILLLIPLLFLISCSKSESDFIWQEIYIDGEALFVELSPDTGFYCCGIKEEKPCFLRYDKKRKLTTTFQEDIQGLFSSAWFDTSGYIVTGSSGGKMLLIRYSPGGEKLWEKSLEAGFSIDYASLFYTGGGRMLAIGTASADSPYSEASGLLFAEFDTTGQVITENEITESDFIAGEQAVIDGDGSIYIALTRKTSNSASKASVVKYNEQLQKLWETELYNNPDFGAASHAIDIDESGIVYVAGKTELSSDEGLINNSFLVSLSGLGSIRWKQYLGSSNEGAAVIFNEAGNIMMMNKNCCVINILESEDGADAGVIRMFDQCDPYTTDIYGNDLVIDNEGNLLMAGTMGGSFHLAIKALQ